jgi:23S rRNA (cytosine1962-C5)-methyltransferase
VTESLPVVDLPAALARAIGAGHPWVYRDHVPKSFRAPTGAWVRIQCGPLSAVALWDADSPLALRIFSRDRVPDPEWVEGRVRDALALRRAVGVIGAASAYRWIGGEGDCIPGIFVDRYAAFAVITADGAAVARIVPWVAEALARTGELAGVLEKRRRGEGEERVVTLWGRPPPRDLLIEENGLRFRANLYEGQKTGLFLDQRDNRSTVERLAGGRSVLNLFGYTGAFSVYAARGGATHVTTVDIAEGAVAAARDNFALNGFDPDAYDFFAEDVFDYLRGAAQRRERFDLVVCDPPSFARSRAHRDRALKAYTRLHAAALAVTAPRGLYAASSCTTQVGPDAFRGTLADGARKARRALQIVHDAGHAPDHPVLAGHPEGRYLKFMVALALPVV